MSNRTSDQNARRRRIHDATVRDERTTERQRPFHNSGKDAATVECMARTIYSSMLDFLLQEIASGAYSIGDQLPTLDALNDRFGSRGPTAGMRAYSELVGRGMVERRHGVGYFLTSLVPVPPSEDQNPLNARLDAIEALLEEALADVRSLRAVQSGTPRLGEWWQIRSFVDHQTYIGVMVAGDGKGWPGPHWFVGVDQVIVRRPLDSFEPIRRLEEIPEWSQE
ncbi:GntR family transcriptional regulator [Prescottella agglutinans]|uniref:DNA-binding transcriptional regulator YhcF (GntR family) n=1 Tax=Prescottella agglutinans TaxID=1644129 RepID=A0ABT6MKU3_9NOCA|nr:GntR family transcriptional regulator [Prescottella agglutinans]MDH6283959.1 DNA-binding transcriptional regulator YhcF (GntR family) [Prescottella agglutinans]